jgi:hypothetical protein
MGGGASTNSSRYHQIGRSQADIVKLMMPIYYIDIEVSPAEIAAARVGWLQITSDTAPQFLALKGTEGFPYLSSTSMFFDLFYNRLFDIHPVRMKAF